jgi:hypothetical protein
VNGLVDEHGTLAQVAWKLIERASGDDVASIERALRRLRGRGQLDGGVWGQRLLRVFGVPATVESRLRWMGLYHSPFNDLPVALCLDQLRVWDRPPVSSSRARVWVQLGFASCALRQQQFEGAGAHVAQASAALGGLDASYDVARVEVILIEAYIASRAKEAGQSVDGAVEALLDHVQPLLASLGETDAACCRARLVDQRAYQLNRRNQHEAALALYESLPAADVHPFASYRRDSGRAYGYYKLGQRERAIELAQRACDHAGDGGYTRLRAMGLLLLAKILGPDAGASALARARAIAERLADDELLARCGSVTTNNL